MRLALTQSAAIKPEPDQSETDDQCRNEDVIRLGQPSGQADRPEHHGEQGCCATDCGDHATRDAGCDKRAILWPFQLLGAEG